MTSRTFTLTVTNGTACNGTVQFTNAANVPAGSTPRQVAVGDFNNDGFQDVAIAAPGNNEVLIGLGNGAGSFNVPTSVPVGMFPHSVAVRDFNNDGR